MLTSTTISGVVIRKNNGWLTLLLITGKKEKVKYAATDLCIGDKVLIAYNHETGKVAGIYGEAPLGLSLEQPPENPEYPLWEDEL